MRHPTKPRKNTLITKELGEAETKQISCELEHDGDVWAEYTTEALTMTCNKNEAAEHGNCLGIANCDKTKGILDIMRAMDTVNGTVTMDTTLDGAGHGGYVRAR